MKNLKISTLITVLVLISTNVTAQRLITTDVYDILYSEVYKQPLSVKYEYPNPYTYAAFVRAEAYEVTLLPELVSVEKRWDAAELIPNLEINDSTWHYIDKTGRKTNVRISEREELPISFDEPTTVEIDTVITINTITTFKIPNGVLTSGPDDYNYPYKPSHLVPLSFSGENGKYNSELWSYVNCGIIHEKLSEVWLKLEEREEEISKTSLLQVNILLSFNPEFKFTESGATIPNYITKILDYRTLDENEKEISITEIYSFPNNQVRYSNDLDAYKVSVN